MYPLISRRALVLATASLSLFKWLPFRAADAQPVRETGFNGGRTQVNLTSVQGGGDFTFINLMKMSQGWSYNRPPSDPHAPPSPIMELDEDGYITRVVPGTNGVYTVFQMPTKTQYDGEWILRWDGNGTLETGSFGVVRTAGSLVSVRGTGSYTFRRLDDGGGPGLRVVATARSPNHVRNIRLCKLKHKDLLDAGQQFDPDSLALMKSAKPGVIRSLGWGGLFNGTNDSQATTWARRMPRTYFSYGSPYANPRFYGGITKNSGSDYTLDYSSFSLVDKALVTLIFNANAPQSANTTINYAVRSGQPIVIPWSSHGLAVGNAVAFGNNRAQPPGVIEAKTYYIIASGFGSSSFQISETPDGSAVLATSTKAGSCVAISIPRININGMGFVPVTGLSTPVPGNVFIGYAGQYPGLNAVGYSVLSNLVYDATTGYFYLNAGGYIAGVPPEVFIDYCAAVGAHPHMVAPYLSVEPVSDFMTSWTTYAMTNYPWMKPRIEPPNETWNSNAAGRATYYAMSLSYALWGTSGDFDNAYGKWASTLGQAISALYGNDRTKYSLIWSMQTSTAVANNFSPNRMSGKYVSVNRGQPAYKWVDRVCFANYFNTGQCETTQELINAFNYYVTFARNPTQQATILANYVADCSLSLAGVNFCIPWAEQAGNNLKKYARSLPAGNTVAGITCYEGGYDSNQESGDVGGNQYSTITAATKTTNCVLTFGNSFSGQNNQLIVQNGNANQAVVGMQIILSGLTGGFATYNGQTVNITGVSGNSITTNLDASAQASAFSGSATATYVNSFTYISNFRALSKSAPTLGIQNAAMLSFVTGLTSAGFVGEFPSNFILTSANNDWSVLDPDIYAPLNSNWNSIVAYNA